MKEKYGAVGVFIIISDSQIPCPDARAGEHCHHPHDINIGASDITPEHAISVIGAGLEQHRM